MLDFQDLYNTYAVDVYRFSYWLCGNSAEAEDITSETFLRAWTHRDNIRTETLRAYLLSISRNLYLESLRRHKPHSRISEAHPDSGPGVEAAYEHRDEIRSIQAALQQIREVDRTAFILRVQHELPYEEIARVLGLSLSAVKVKVHRVRLKLISMVKNEETLS
ncbi:MAG TPA: RNA polymerase sigma factor [Anaerolineales bacterium]|nr:RNA polymerase sigma factor [Anaerolineales bacterium]